MSSDLLDCVYRVQTPEGIDINLRLAGVWSRSVAWIIDLFIRGVFYLFIYFLTIRLGSFGTGLMLIGFFMVEWFYPVFFEVLNRGMTPGKKLFNIQVLNSDGTPVGWSPSVLRNLLRTVDFLPFFYGFGFIAMLMNDRFQRLGDLAADTVVVYQHRNKTVQTVAEQLAIKPAYPLNLKEQQDIIHYAERASQLSNERLTELAKILNPLDVPEHHMTKEKLLGIANGLLGRK